MCRTTGWSISFSVRFWQVYLFTQIGEEMSQNSFIKQYLAKQQELLRQRLEREAREAAETDGEWQCLNHIILKQGSPILVLEGSCHVLDVSLLQHTCFKWMGRYQALWKLGNDHSFESGVLEQVSAHLSGPQFDISIVFFNVQNQRTLQMSTTAPPVLQTRFDFKCSFIVYDLFCCLELACLNCVFKLRVCTFEKT